MTSTTRSMRRRHRKGRFPSGTFPATTGRSTRRPSGFGACGMNARLNLQRSAALQELAGGRHITAVIVDPSAASFIALLQREGWTVRRAKNDVLSGIRRTSDLLKRGKLVICAPCRDCLREMEQYVWDVDAGRDTVRKEHDHAMDDMRYFVATALCPGQAGGFAARAVQRGGRG